MHTKLIRVCASARVRAQLNVNTAIKSIIVCFVSFFLFYFQLLNYNAISRENDSLCIISIEPCSWIIHTSFTSLDLWIKINDWYTPNTYNGIVLEQPGALCLAKKNTKNWTCGISKHWCQKHWYIVLYYRVFALALLLPLSWHLRTVLFYFVSFGFISCETRFIRFLVKYYIKVPHYLHKAHTQHTHLKQQKIMTLWLAIV